MIKSNKGFSAVVVLLSILVVTAVGFTGYYVYNNQKEDEQQAQTEQQITSTQAADTATSADPVDSQKYLVIKEWGVKIELTDILSDASYEYKTFDGGNTGASLIVAIPEDSAGACNEQAIISRVLYEDYLSDQENDGFLKGFNGGTQIGNYYYFLQPSQSSCVSENTPADKVISEKAQAIRSEWIKQASTIKSTEE